MQFDNVEELKMYENVSNINQDFSLTAVVGKLGKNNS